MRNQTIEVHSNSHIPFSRLDYERIMHDLKYGQLNLRMTRIEDIAPDFTFGLQNKNSTSFYNAIKNKTTLLIFAPSEESILAAINAHKHTPGVNTYIVTPKLVDYASLTNITIIHDKSNDIATLYGLTLTATPQMLGSLRTLGIHEEYLEEYMHPAHATYLISPQRRVLFSYIDLNTHANLDLDNLNETLRMITKR